MASVFVRLLIVAALIQSAPALAQTGRGRAWVGAWTASPQAQPLPLKPLKDVTVRQRIRLAAGGSELRLTISNAYGTRPLVIGAASVRNGGTIVPITFGGDTTIAAAIGSPVLSDPVRLAVAAEDEVEVSLYLPEETLPETWHRSIATTPGGPVPTPGQIAAGDLTRQVAMPGASPSGLLFLSRIDVLPTRPVGAVVVLGTTRTVDSGWQDLLGRRLGPRFSVLNASMVANPLTRPYPGGGDAALARFDRDVLMTPGISHVILADAANDIGQAGREGRILPTVEGLAAAYRQLAARAHAQGVKVIVATVMPFGEVPFADFYSPEKEGVRQGLNAWLRSSREFDGLIDMDAMLRDSGAPSRFRAGLDTANHFGPNDAGSRIVAETIDLSLFR